MSVPEAQGLTQGLLKKILKKFEKQLEGKQVEGSSGNGAVSIVISAKFQVLNVKINPRLAYQLDQLEELVGAAVDDVLQRGGDLLKSEAQKLLGGL